MTPTIQVRNPIQRYVLDLGRNGYSLLLLLLSAIGEAYYALLRRIYLAQVYPFDSLQICTNTGSEKSSMYVYSSCSV